MSNENDAYRITEIPANFPAEDLVLKSAMQFFKDELLSYLGITEEPVTMGRQSLSTWRQSSYMKILTSSSLTGAGFIWSLRAMESGRRICGASAAMKRSLHLSVVLISRRM